MQEPDTLTSGERPGNGSRINGPSGKLTQLEVVFEGEVEEVGRFRAVGGEFQRDGKSRHDLEGSESL